MYIYLFWSVWQVACRAWIFNPIRVFIVRKSLHYECMSTTSPLNLWSRLRLFWNVIQWRKCGRAFVLFAQTNTKSFIIIHDNKMILNLTSSDHVDFAWLLYSYECNIWSCPNNTALGPIYSCFHFSIYSGSPFNPRNIFI